MKHIVINGTTGFIGQHLVKLLLSKNFRVTSIVRDKNKVHQDLINVNHKIIELGFHEYQNLNNYIDCNFDIFIHLAWSGYGKNTNNVDAQIENIIPVIKAMQFSSEKMCKRFIFVSSFSEYMIDENETMQHIEGAASNIYGSVKKATRIIAHSLSKQLNIEFISVALANTFGPGDISERSTNVIIKKLLDEEPVLLTHGNHLYDWIYINDTVNGIISASLHGKPDEFYYIGDQLRPLKEIIREVRDHISPEVDIILGAYEEKFHVDYSSVDINKLYKHTSFKPKTNFLIALDETVKWIKQMNIKEEDKVAGKYVKENSYENIDGK